MTTALKIGVDKPPNFKRCQNYNTYTHTHTCIYIQRENIAGLQVM